MDLLFQLAFAFPVIALLMVAFGAVSLRLHGTQNVRLYRATSATTVFLAIACLPLFAVMALGVIALYRD